MDSPSFIRAKEVPPSFSNPRADSRRKSMKAGRMSPEARRLDDFLWQVFGGMPQPVPRDLTAAHCGDQHGRLKRGPAISACRELAMSVLAQRLNRIKPSPTIAV